MTEGRARWVIHSQNKANPGDCSYPRTQQSKARSGCSGKHKGPRSKQSQYGNKTGEGTKQGYKRRKVFSGWKERGRGNTYLEAMPLPQVVTKKKS